MGNLQFDVWPALPILVPAAYGLLLLVFAPAFRDMQRWLAGIAVLGLGMTGVSAAMLWIGLPKVGYWVETAGVGDQMLIRADSLAVFFDLLFAVVGILAVLSAPAYFDRQGTHRPEFYALVLLAVSGMAMMVGSESLVVIFIGLETLSLSLYVMAGAFRDRARSLEAALKYFLLGAFATGFLLYGIALTYGATGTMHLRAMGQALAGLADPAGNLLLMAGLALLLIGLAFKVAAVPFHTWAPDVYQGAPTPVTAFMAAGTKAAAFAVLARLVITAMGGAEGLGEFTGVWTSLLTGLAILTMTAGNVLALVQHHAKRMLAYSSVAHAGYLLIPLVALLEGGKGAADGRALPALGFYLVTYTFMTMGAFAVLARISHGDRDADHLSHLAGLGRRRPVLAALMVLFMVSLIGIPPTGGFLGKYYLFLAAMESKLYLLATVGVLNAVIAAAYYLRIVVFVSIRKPEPELEPAAGPDLPAAVALGIAAVATLLLGLWPGPVVEWASHLYAGLAPVGQFTLLP